MYFVYKLINRLPTYYFQYTVGCFSAKKRKVTQIEMSLRATKQPAYVKIYRTNTQTTCLQRDENFRLNENICIKATRITRRARGNERGKKRVIFD